jgi:hypothetical protein
MGTAEVGSTDSTQPIHCSAFLSPMSDFLAHEADSIISREANQWLVGHSLAQRLKTVPPAATKSQLRVEK